MAVNPHPHGLYIQPGTQAPPWAVAAHAVAGGARHRSPCHAPSVASSQSVQQLDALSPLPSTVLLGSARRPAFTFRLPEQFEGATEPGENHLAWQADWLCIAHAPSSSYQSSPWRPSPQLNHKTTIHINYSS